MIPLTLTVEKTQGAADWFAAPEETPDWGCAVIKIGDHEIGQVELTYNEWDDGRDGLEHAAARWLKEHLGGKA